MKMTTRIAMRYALGASLAAMATAGLSTPVFAQGAEEESSGLGDIIVTARKVEENLQDVPVAVTVQTGEQLEVTGAVKVQDVAKFTPGMYMREATSSPAGVSIGLRGQVQSDVLITLDPSVGTYVDGVYWARAYGLNADLLDIQSVQVLKGPQGTLFGRNTTGGAMLFQTNDPSLDDLSGKLTLTYGRFDERVGTAVVNVPIVADRVAVRLAGKISKRDGWAHDIGLGNLQIGSQPLSNVVTGREGTRLNERNEKAFRGKLLIKPTDNLSLLFSADYWKTDAASPARRITYVTPGNVTIPTLLPTELQSYSASAIANGCTSCVLNQYGPYPTPTAALVAGGSFPGGGTAASPAATTGTLALQSVIGLLAQDKNAVALDAATEVLAETQTYGFTAALDTDFGEIRLITGYRKFMSDTNLELDGSPYPIHQTTGIQSGDQWSAELQTTGTAFNDALDFAVGAFYFHENAKEGSMSPVGAFTRPATAPATGLVNQAAATTNISLFNSRIDNDSIGAYFQGSWHITDALTATGGVRYSVDDKGILNRSGTINMITAGFADVDANGLVTAIYPENISDFDALDFARTACNFDDTADTTRTTCPGYIRKDSFSGWSYTLGLDYKITDDIMIYAKTSKGFRSGGQNLRATNLTTAQAFDPEKAFSHEGGLKSQLFNNRVRVNLAGYYTTIKDIQRTTLILVYPTGCTTDICRQTATVLSNAGKARVWGLEGELTVEPIDNFVVAMGAGYVNPKYLDFKDSLPTRTNLTGDRSTERFRDVAKFNFSAQANYTIPFGDDNSVVLNVNYAHSSKIASSGEVAFIGDPLGATIDPWNGKTVMENIIDATTIQPSDVVGASATLNLGERLSITAWGRNLTNDRGRVTALYVATGYVNESLREPTTYGLTVTGKF